MGATYRGTSDEKLKSSQFKQLEVMAKVQQGDKLSIINVDINYWLVQLHKEYVKNGRVFPEELAARAAMPKVAADAKHDLDDLYGGSGEEAKEEAKGGEDAETEIDSSPISDALLTQGQQDETPTDQPLFNVDD